MVVGRVSPHQPEAVPTTPSSSRPTVSHHVTPAFLLEIFGPPRHGVTARMSCHRSGGCRPRRGMPPPTTGLWGNVRRGGRSAAGTTPTPRSSSPFLPILPLFLSPCRFSSAPMNHCRHPAIYLENTPLAASHSLFEIRHRDYSYAYDV